MDGIERFLLTLGRHLMEVAESNMAPGLEPYVEVNMTDDCMRLVAELPGVNPGDIRVRVSDGQVAVRVVTEGIEVYSKAFDAGSICPGAAEIRHRNGVLLVCVPRKKALF